MKYFLNVWFFKFDLSGCSPELNLNGCFSLVFQYLSVISLSSKVIFEYLLPQIVGPYMIGCSILLHVTVYYLKSYMIGCSLILHVTVYYLKSYMIGCSLLLHVTVYYLKSYMIGCSLLLHVTVYYLKSYMCGCSLFIDDLSSFLNNIMHISVFFCFLFYFSVPSKTGGESILIKKQNHRRGT